MSYWRWDKIGGEDLELAKAYYDAKEYDEVIDLLNELRVPPEPICCGYAELHLHFKDGIKNNFYR